MYLTGIQFLIALNQREKSCQDHIYWKNPVPPTQYVASISNVSRLHRDSGLLYHPLN